MLRTQKARHKEFKQRPQLEKVVFDGRTRKAQAHAGIDAAHGAGCDGVGVLDVLGFVKNHGVKLVLLHFLQIAPQKRVGGDDEV